jgi:hypothetical protein
MSESNRPAEKSPLQQAVEDWWAEISEDERTQWMASAEALWGPGTATIEDAYLRYLAVGSIREVIQKVRRGE